MASLLNVSTSTFQTQVPTSAAATPNDNTFLNDQRSLQNNQQKQRSASQVTLISPPTLNIENAAAPPCIDVREGRSEEDRASRCHSTATHNSSSLFCANTSTASTTDFGVGGELNSSFERDQHMVRRSSSTATSSSHRHQKPSKQERSRQLWQKIRDSFDDGKLKKCAATTTLSTARVPDFKLGDGMRIPGGCDISVCLRRTYQTNSEMFAFYFSVEFINSPLISKLLSVLFWLIVVDNFRHNAGIEYLAALFANFSFFFGAFALSYEKEYKLEVTLGSTPSAAAHTSGLSSKSDWRSAFCELAATTLQLALEQTFPIEHDKVCSPKFLLKMKMDLQVWIIGIPMSQFTDFGNDNDYNKNNSSGGDNKSSAGGGNVRMNKGIINEDGTFSLRDANVLFIAQLSQQDGTTKTIRQRPTSAHKLAVLKRDLSAANNTTMNSTSGNASGIGSSADSPFKRSDAFHPAQGQTHQQLLNQTIEAVEHTTFGFIAQEAVMSSAAAATIMTMNGEQQNGNNNNSFSEGGGVSALSPILDAVGRVEAQLAEDFKKAHEGPRREPFSTRHQALLQQQVKHSRMDYHTAIAQIQFEAMVAAERQRREKIALIGKPIFADEVEEEERRKKMGREEERFKQLKDHEYVPNRGQITERFGIDMSAPVMRIFLSFAVSAAKEMFSTTKAFADGGGHVVNSNISIGNSTTATAIAVGRPASAASIRSIRSLSASTTRTERPMKTERLLDPKTSSLLHGDRYDQMSNANGSGHHHSHPSAAAGASGTISGGMSSFAMNEKQFIDYIASMAEGRTTMRLTQERFRIRCHIGAHDVMTINPNLFKLKNIRGGASAHANNGNSTSSADPNIQHYENLVVTPENLNDFLAENDDVKCSRKTLPYFGNNNGALSIPPKCSLCKAKQTLYYCAICNVSMCRSCRPEVGSGLDKNNSLHNHQQQQKQQPPSSAIIDLDPILVFGSQLSRRVFEPEHRVEIVDSKFKMIVSNFHESKENSEEPQRSPRHSSQRRSSSSDHQQKKHGESPASIRREHRCGGEHTPTSSSFSVVVNSPALMKSSPAAIPAHHQRQEEGYPSATAIGASPVSHEVIQVSPSTQPINTINRMAMQSNNSRSVIGIPPVSSSAVSTSAMLTSVNNGPNRSAFSFRPQSAASVRSSSNSVITNRPSSAMMMRSSSSAAHQQQKMNSTTRPFSAATLRHPKSNTSEKQLGDYIHHGQGQRQQNHPTVSPSLRPFSAASASKSNDQREHSAQSQSQSQQQQRPNAAALWSVGTRELITGEEIPVDRKLQKASLQNRPIHHSLKETNAALHHNNGAQQQQQRGVIANSNGSVRSNSGGGNVDATLSTPFVSGAAPYRPQSLLQVIRGRTACSHGGNESFETEKSQCTGGVGSGGISSMHHHNNSGSNNGPLLHRSTHSCSRDNGDDSSVFITALQHQDNGSGIANTRASAAAVNGAGGRGGAVPSTTAPSGDILKNFATGGNAHKIAHGTNSASSIGWSPADANTVTSFHRIRQDIASRTQKSLSHIAEIKRSEQQAKQKSLQNEKNNHIFESCNVVEGIQKARELERILKRQQQRTLCDALRQATNIMEERLQKFNEAPPSIDHRHSYNALLIAEINHQKQNIITLRDLLYELPTSTHSLVHKFVCDRRLYISELSLTFKTNNHDVQQLWPSGINDPYVLVTPAEIERLTAPFDTTPGKHSSGGANNEIPKNSAEVDAFILSLSGSGSCTPSDDPAVTFGLTRPGSTAAAIDSNEQSTHSAATPNSRGKNAAFAVGENLSALLEKQKQNPPRKIEALMVPSSDRLKVAKDKRWHDIRDAYISVEMSEEEKVKAAIDQTKVLEERQREREERAHAKETFGLLRAESFAVNSAQYFAQMEAEKVAQLTEAERIKGRQEHIRKLAGVKKSQLGQNISSIGGQLVWDDSGMMIGSSASTYLLARRKAPTM